MNLVKQKPHRGSFFPCKPGSCLLLLACAGCGTATIMSSDAPAKNTPFATRVFPDDEDPAVQALAFVETELLAQPFPGVDRDQLKTVIEQAGAVETEHLADIDLTTLAVSADQMQEVADELARSGLIEEIHKNYLLEPQTIPDDPLFRRQPHLPQVSAPLAWDMTLGDASIPIAIVDTGTEEDHPDLADKIIDGWNIVDADANFADTVGHGTETAGVAGASSDNRTGIAGLAWNNPLLIVRVTNSRGRSTSRNLAAGILWAVDHGAKVINVSFAPLWSNRVVRAAAQQAFARGALVVISAGNGGAFHQAAGYPEALFVGAVTGSNQIARFSDQGPFVDLVAPGTAIRTTTRGATYGLANGTSFSAPIVSGVAALAWSVNPDLRPASIQNALLTTAQDLGLQGRDDTFGQGIVDARAAVEAALDTVEIPDTQPPTVRITRPAAATLLSGKTGIAVTASDDEGIADVTLSLDDIPIAADARPPYRFVIDTASYPAGLHTLRAVATDLAGHASQPDSVQVRFAAAPSHAPSAAITFRSPQPGTRVSGNVTISATVTAQAGLATVEWFVDGEAVVADAVAGRSSGVSYLWRTASVSRGPHTLTLVVTDGRGQRSSADLRLVVR